MLAGAAVLAYASVPALAGPNLMAIGDFSETPFKRAVGRDSVNRQEIIYTFSDPELDFGRVIIRSSSPNSVVRRDLFVGYNGGGLLVDPRGAGGGNVRIDELEVWLRIKGKVLPGRTYEWEFDGGGADRIDDGVPAVVPAMWADGAPIGVEVAITDPPDDVEKIQRLRLPHGVVKVPSFERQTGAAWVVLKPERYGNYFGVRRFSFREIDSDLIDGIESAMPVPVRYIPIKSALESRIAQVQERGSETLKARQNRDGFWGPTGNIEQSIQITSTVVSALAELGEPTDEGGVARAMKWLAAQAPGEDETWAVETVADRLYCLARYGGMKDYREQISADLEYLNDAQFEDGGWSQRSRSAERRATAIVNSDNAHSFDALRALREAAFAGADVDRAMWRRVMKYWTDAQVFDGGFQQKLARYGGVGEATTSAYTAQGAAALITALDMSTGLRSRRCHRYLASKKQLRAIQAALDWLDTNYKEQFKDIGSLVQDADPYAEPVSMQALGAISGIAHFNDKDYFDEAADALLGHYDSGSGLFGVRRQGGWAESPNLRRTGAAMLALAGGAAPTICQRIIAGDTADRWAQLSSDVQHVVRYISAARGRQFNWRRSTIDRDVRELVEVPIMFLDFVGESDWDDAAWHKIRAYCHAGGTVVVNIAETKDPARRDDVQARVESGLRQAFPEYELKPLAADDDILTIEEELEPAPALRFLTNGLRKFLFVTGDDWSCHWHVYDTDRRREAFAFMNNLLTYCTDGTPPRSSFAPSTYASGSSPIKAMTAARLEVGGAVPAFPDLMETMHRLMQANYRMSVTEHQDPAQADLLWVTVTGPTQPDEPAKQRMLDAVRAGRFLFVDVATGNEDWDETSRAWLRGLDPKIALVSLRRNDAVFTGEIPGTQGFDVVTVPFRKALQTRFAKSGRCALYRILYDGDPVGVYSAHDVASGVGYHLYPDCRGPMPESARRIAMNVMLSAFGWRQHGRPVF